MRLSTIVLAMGVLAGCGQPATSPSTAPQSSPPTATPPDPAAGHILSGTITEPGVGPLPGVEVSTRPNPAAGPARTGTAITDAAGHYRMENVAGCLWVKLTLAGYETSEHTNCVELNKDAVFDSALQRVLRIEAGGALDNTVWTNDPVWAINILEDISCDGPCKFIRIVVPTDGTLIAQLSSTLSKAHFGLWLSDYGGFKDTQHLVGTGEISGSLAVSATKEANVWIEGGEGVELPFHLNTRLLAPGEFVDSSARARRVFGFAGGATPGQAFRAHN